MIHDFNLYPNYRNEDDEMLYKQKILQYILQDHLKNPSNNYA